ncbi:hypothetical protein LCGC14_2630950 [marine sediment metagenome]|uniref:Nucleoside 2-deoxyribosyltransferase n=1 Tax=marine sediment metagenome TaxID=412755 RepID=A0A0F9A062_9ZZZZ
MSRPIVYVAGPMSHLSWEEMNGWREAVRRALPECEVLSPLRGKEWIKNMPAALTSKEYPEPFGNSKAITRRDHWDVTHSDLIIVNAHGRREGGVGRATICEMAWAWDHQIPIILVVDKDDPFQNHVFIMEFALEIVPTLGIAVDLARTLLNLSVANVYQH